MHKNPQSIAQRISGSTTRFRIKYNISSSVSADSSFAIQRAQTKVKESKYSLNKLHKFSTDNALVKKYYFYPSIIP